MQLHCVHGVFTYIALIVYALALRTWCIHLCTGAWTYFQMHALAYTCIRKSVHIGRDLMVRKYSYINIDVFIMKMTDLFLQCLPLVLGSPPGLHAVGVAKLEHDAGSQLYPGGIKPAAGGYTWWLHLLREATVEDCTTYAAGILKIVFSLVAVDAECLEARDGDRFCMRWCSSTVRDGAELV